MFFNFMGKCALKRVRGAIAIILARCATRAFLQSLFIFLAFGALLTAFARSDFSLALVAFHSHSTKPLFFQMAASWGNHEGSLLLWVLLLALGGALFARFYQEEAMKAKRGSRLYFYTLFTQAMISLLFLAFLIFASNPFARLNPAPFQGAGLNPILQDIALTIHPPILYIGYVGFSIVFSLACAGLWARAIDRDWARLLIMPVMISWSALTAGIALGSWWAYRELGWGGFWFWDPVENASLMPWLAATALFHACVIGARRGIGLYWVVLLGFIGFFIEHIGDILNPFRGDCVGA